MKERTIRIGRREFTAAGVMALLSGVAITISACGSTSTPSSPSSPGGTTAGLDANGNLNGVVSANHGHTAQITAVQLSARNAVTLDMRGQADHTHSLTLTGDQVASAAAGQRVSMTSSNEQGHDHVVTFN